MATWFSQKITVYHPRVVWALNGHIYQKLVQVVFVKVIALFRIFYIVYKAKMESSHYFTKNKFQILTQQTSLRFVLEQVTDVVHCWGFDKRFLYSCWMSWSTNLWRCLVQCRTRGLWWRHHVYVSLWLLVQSGKTANERELSGGWYLVTHTNTTLLRYSHVTIISNIYIH